MVPKLIFKESYTLNRNLYRFGITIFIFGVNVPFIRYNLQIKHVLLLVSLSSLMHLMLTTLPHCKLKVQIWQK